MKTPQLLSRNPFTTLSAGILAAALTCGVPSYAAWEPTKPVELLVPAGRGGGADQMARLIQDITAKHKLLKEPMVVINKSAGAGAESFMEVKTAKGDAHKLVVTLSNLFTTPIAIGVPFTWRDMTPVSMMALDQFVLWVNAESPYQNAKDYVDAAKAAGPGKMKMAGTGAKQEDQILTVGMERATGVKFTYMPFKGGGEVANQLVAKTADSTVNNPAEAVNHWRSGKLRPLCVFDNSRMPYKTKITETQSWSDVPTCKESGLASDYIMLRGIFMSPGASRDQLEFYVNLLKKVRETPEWSAYMERGAFNQTTMSGEAFEKWLVTTDSMHRGLMKEAGFNLK
jgi:tripartite-type tricarboxylate transporter receptor subunit TctC